MATHSEDSASMSVPEAGAAIDKYHYTISTITQQPITSQPVAEGDTDSDSDSGVDASSTIVYDHESFSTFQSRVKNLVLETIWSDANNENITIERLKGGGYNRIIGATRHIGHELNNDVQDVLRLPRFEKARLDRDVANLQFLQRYSSIPAPTVITFDTKTENQLQGPYMIQKRIIGTDLYATFPKLAHEDRCRVAKEVGNVLNQMLALESDVAGVLTFSLNKENLQSPIYVASFPSVDPEQQPVPYCKARTTRPVLELLTDLFQNQKAASLRDYPDDFVELEKMDAFCTMASELDAAGWLTDVPNCLAHLDFAPRNVLVNPSSAPNEPIITAVLDWDSAVLAPSFMACTPRMWIWAWKDDDDEDERKANDDPPDPKNHQLKQIFEMAAGEEYIRFAYEPAYRLARRLVRFAIHGLRSNEDYYESDEMFAEWERICAEASTSRKEPSLVQD